MSAAPAKSEGAGFSARVALALVIVGVVSFAAFLVLSAFASELRTPAQGGTHAQSKSAIGFAGIVALLQAEGQPVRTTRDPLNRIGEARGLVVLTPGLGDAPPREISNIARGADRLIVLPKWRTEGDPDNPDWVRRTGIASTSAVKRSLDHVADFAIVEQRSDVTNVELRDGSGSDMSFGAITAGAIRQLQTLNDDSFVQGGRSIQPILVDDRGYTVLARLKPEFDDHPSSARVWILSDPDLLNTQGLASPVTAAAGLAIMHRLAPAGTQVAFDMTLHGLGRSRNLLKLMLVPPFLPAVLCLAFAALLMGVHAAAGGGVKRRAGRELALGKTGLVENSALLIALARRELGIGRRYAAVARMTAAASAGIPSGLSESQQTDMLDAAGRASRTEASFTALAAETAAAPTPAVQLRAVQRLYHWRQELMRGRQRS